jgi:hypothetical protein
MLTAKPAGLSRLAPRIMAAARLVERAVIPVSKITTLKSLSFLVKMFRRPVPTKQFSQTTKPFSVFKQTSGNSRWLSSYQRTGAQRLYLNRRQPMRTISFILGFAFILAGPSIAGSSDGSLPGVGTFSYNSSPAFTVVAGN